MSSYNPYNRNQNNSILGNFNTQENTFYNNRIARLSMFGRNYVESAIKNAKGIHANEDITMLTDSNGYSYSVFSRKAYALMQERQTVAALSVDYLMKLPILREYATKTEVREYISKMANEVIVYGKDKKFCELEDLPSTYSEVIRNKAKSIFENVYAYLGFSDGSYAWDICRDWLVEGYIAREIIYDKKGKNIIGFQKLDPATLYPIVDEASGIKLWIQHPYDEVNRRIIMDAEMIYISYSGSSNYMETSYVEPLIRPYNELKSIERSRLLFNLINATMHKEFIIPTQGLPPHLAEQEIATLIADYKDHVAFDDTTGLIYIDGSKDLPYSKEYWLPNPGDQKPEMSIIEPGGHDLNESSMLVWFSNSLKRASKFPLSRLDAQTGGGNVYSFGSDLTHDDYNFQQYVERLRALFKDIILKPIIIQLLLEFPELEKDNRLYNDLDIKYYGHSELIKAKMLANMQAKAAIASELTNNLKQSEEKPLLHWKMIAKHIMEFDDEFMAENAKYWAESDSAAGANAGEGVPEGGEGAPAELGGEGGDELPSVQGEGGEELPPIQGEGGGGEELPPAEEPPAE
jgi:hypothetical protein